jgi:NitT/TauT family transport system permease protein
MKKHLNRLFLFLEGFLLINLIWYIGYLILHTTVIPNPLIVYQNFGTIFADDILIHILQSLKRIGLGLSLSLLVGVPIGILMAYSNIANKILYPLIYFSYPIPKTALLPIAMLLLGMRDGSKIAIIFLIIVFQVIVAVRDSINNIDSSMYLVTVSAGASKRQIIWHITLPAILPELLTSLRVSLGTAVSVLFFVEGYGTRYGMGYYIVDAWSRIDYISMYSGIIVISIVGFALFAAVDLLSVKLCPWR